MNSLGTYWAFSPSSATRNATPARCTSRSAAKNAAGCLSNSQRWFQITSGGPSSAAAAGLDSHGGEADACAVPARVGRGIGAVPELSRAGGDSVSAATLPKPACASRRLPAARNSASAPPAPTPPGSGNRQPGYRTRALAARASGIHAGSYSGMRRNTSGSAAK